ncbi:hypoxanthine phosphoribosyltransferase [candidate division WOR-3 bacterium JGI_Cruoil_03_51_56]|uniref:Hypoxanthine phosphoribosyltransferase n=1 Tax=candidate division WOR-3 bacterium JGI_Cruoil_03_51_56 TaxID=1973747 RepID=A0A235BR35_UNCW3|nr:MAG: hypoxanthine phosphoribosyltransferase [candidate division WOR-3 bacterium JGI_Cruoil_03_51_56]
MKFNEVQVHELISEEKIKRRVAELARQISSDYANQELTVVGVLKGSWIFLADLVRQVTVPVVIDFMAVSSYGKSTDSSGVVKIVTDLRCPLENRNVLLVEDILDSGLTLKYIIKHIKLRGPSSLRVCALMDKPARRRVDIKADYVGFGVPDKFVVGYGVDYDERFRNLPYVGYIEENDETEEG